MGEEQQPITADTAADTAADTTADTAADFARRARLDKLADPALPPREAFVQVDEYETGWLAGAPHHLSFHHPCAPRPRSPLTSKATALQKATCAQRFTWRGWR